MVMPEPEGNKTTKKQVIEIRFIEDEEIRFIENEERKAELLEKASELSQLCGAHAAVVIFSKKQELPQQGGNVRYLVVLYYGLSQYGLNSSWPMKEMTISTSSRSNGS